MLRVSWSAGERIKRARADRLFRAAAENVANSALNMRPGNRRLAVSSSVGNWLRLAAIPQRIIVLQRVLIVDDDSEFLEASSKLLSALGCATTGSSAGACRFNCCPFADIRSCVPSTAAVATVARFMRRLSRNISPARTRATSRRSSTSLVSCVVWVANMR